MTRVPEYLTGASDVCGHWFRGLWRRLQLAGFTPATDKIPFKPSDRISLYFGELEAISHKYSKGPYL